MKALCICASPRHNGSCSFILDCFINGFISEENTAEKVCISDVDIQYCRGCKKCYENGICIQKDGVLNLVKKMLDSDIVVIAAPSYWAGVPGQLKTFFDRNTPFGDTNPNRIVKAKKQVLGVSIVVRAGNSEKENEIILDFIEHYYGHMGIAPIQRFSIRNTDSLDDLITKQKRNLEEICAFAASLGKNDKGETI